ncbi:MAG: alpha/beta hydrolase [Kofleriaceae bacterium]
MPSKQSDANKQHYETSAARPPSTDPADAIEYADIHWTALTAEPGGVDYLEVTAAGTRAMWIVPHGADPTRVIFYAHGGGFISGSIYTHRKMVGHLAKAAGCRALLYDFAYAHEHPYPHQLDTTVGIYQWLVEQGVPATQIALAGDSAGAILAVGLLQRLRNQGLPVPAALVLLSGWLDMTQSAESFQTNAAKDKLFSRDTVSWLAGNVLGSMDRRDPLASPLHADLAGLPSMYLQAGEDETLVGESRMFAERARSAGVAVELDVFPGMLHTFQMMAGRAPEADEAIRKLGAWVRRHLRG